MRENTKSVDEVIQTCPKYLSANTFHTGIIKQGTINNRAGYLISTKNFPCDLSPASQKNFLFENFCKESNSFSYRRHTHSHELYKLNCFPNSTRGPMTANNFNMNTRNHRKTVSNSTCSYLQQAYLQNKTVQKIHKFAFIHANENAIFKPFIGTPHCITLNEFLSGIKRKTAKFIKDTTKKLTNTNISPCSQHSRSRSIYMGSKKASITMKIPKSHSKTLATTTITKTQKRLRNKKFWKTETRPLFSNSVLKGIGSIKGRDMTISLRTTKLAAAFKNNYIRIPK